MIQEVHSRPNSMALFEKLDFEPCDIASKDRFVCVIFSDEDAEMGVKVIRKYHEMGYRVWYDITLSGKTMIAGALRDALDACSAAVFLHNSKSYFDPYYWNLYKHVQMMGQRWYMLHIEEFEYNSVTMKERVSHSPLRPETDQFERELKYVYYDAYPEEENGAHARGLKYDPAFVISDDCERFYTVNLRTHEGWNRERVPVGVVSTDELSPFILQLSGVYSMLPVSYAADYSESNAEKARVAETERVEREEEKRRIEREEAEKRRKEENAKKEREYYRLHTFPRGYPYMDEFERLGSDE